MTRPPAVGLKRIATLNIGSRPASRKKTRAIEDLRAMQFEDVQTFFRTYYHASNASLVIAGDIDTERAFDLAEHYFGELPAGPPPAPVVGTAALDRESRWEACLRGSLTGAWQGHVLDLEIYPQASLPKPSSR